MDTTNRPAWITQSVNAALCACALGAGLATSLPWLGTSGICLLGANALAMRLSLRPRHEERWKLALVATWLGALVLPGAFLLAADALLQVEDTSERYCVILAWLINTMILPVNSPLLRPDLRARLRLPALAAAFFAGSVLLVVAWSHNQLLAFRVGVIVNLLLLALAKVWWPQPTWAVPFVNTLLLLGVGLPVADFVFQPDYHTALQPAELTNYYSFAAARKNPEAFAHWWAYYGEQWQQFSRVVMRAGPRLQPDSRATLVHCPIQINSRGFRGKEIAPDKGNAYRIVALGESTTFGITINPSDRPWPEVLEEMIRSRLKLQRPVEVINAGVPAIVLPENLARLSKDILPLRPDLIISYHGLNGFNLLTKALPSVRGRPPPRFQPRPLKLVAAAEYRLKMLRYRRQYAAQSGQRIEAITDPLATDYGRAYQQLIEIVATNHVRLVLANYSMAVNRHSDPDALEFYRVGYPGIAAHIVANVAHTKLLEQLARQHPEIALVDTQPALDGQHELFIDAVHFTQEGRQRLAETFFANLKPILERECGQPGSPTDAR